MYRRRLAVTAGAEWRAVRQECLRDVLPDTVSGQLGEFYERFASSAAGLVQTAKQGLRRTPPWLRFIARYRSSESLVLRAPSALQWALRFRVLLRPFTRGSRQ